MLAGGVTSLRSIVFKLFLMSLMKSFLHSICLMLKFFAAVDFDHV